MSDDQKEKPVFTYVEIVETESSKVVKRIDVSGRSDSSVGRVERGVENNLNHDDYFTRVCSYQQKQEEDP